MKKSISSEYDHSDMKEESFIAILQKHGVSEKTTHTIEELHNLDVKSTAFQTMQSLLMWDQETYMPHEGITTRAIQCEMLELYKHEAIVNARVPELLHELGVSEETPMGSENIPNAIRRWLRAKYIQWKKATSIPPALLAEIAKESVFSHQKWIEARENNNFLLFSPYLKKLIDLKKQYAMAMGCKGSIYNALLDDFEPRCTTDMLDTIFGSLKEKLVPFYNSLVDKHSKNTFSSLRVPIEKQKEFCKLIACHMGYSKDTGRIDEAAHPFCTTIGWHDVRITTRYLENEPLSAIFSVLHEMGHAFYELGISNIYMHTVCMEGASYGVHESQSEFLENIIGKSRHFWSYWHNKMSSLYGEGYENEGFDGCMRRIRHVKKNLIRVESDEVGYNLHIILRYTIEKAIFEGEICVNDIPTMWNELSEQLLGCRPPTNREGVLQDVHWSEGAFGYFPSYALGNMYSIQLKKEIERALPHYTQELEEGKVENIIQWLKQRIHIHGSSKFPNELYKEIETDTIMEYLTQRYDINS